MRVFYTPRYYADIGAHHIFPIRKFELVRDRLLDEGTLRQEELVEPEPATLENVQLVHTEDYVSRLCNGTLTAKELRRLGMPWSESLVRRSFYAVGGTICAARHALEAGFSSNLAGGTHHAFADRGEGFCVFNDVAIAIRALRGNLMRRAAVVDCDVHQGNGTAAIFRDEPAVFTFSLHGARNFPFRKETSDLDVTFEDGAGDDEYLAALGEHLPAVLDTHRPDVVFYLAGADPYEGDRLGRLRLTIDGLRTRDRLVFDACRDRGLPVAVVMSGGYAPDVDAIVTIHTNTIREAVHSCQSLFAS